MFLLVSTFKLDYIQGRFKLLHFRQRFPDHSYGQNPLTLTNGARICVPRRIEEQLTNRLHRLPNLQALKVLWIRHCGASFTVARLNLVSLTVLRFYLKRSCAFGGQQ